MWRIIALRQVASVGKQTLYGHVEVGVREHGAMVAGQHNASRVRSSLFGRFVVVASSAVPIQDRLNVARKVENIGAIFNWLDTTWRSAESLQVGRGDDRLRTLFVTADASGRFARLDSQETLHPLDGHVMLVQRHEEQPAQGGQLHISRPVFLDRHGPQDSLQGERPAIRQRIHAAGVVDGFGKTLQDQQLLDFTALDALHISATIDIHQRQVADLQFGLRAGRDAALALRGASGRGSWHCRPWFRSAEDS